MMNWTLARIAAVTQGRILGGAQAAEPVVNGLTTDTRAIAQGQLFVALAGERFDAHDFLAAAVQAGAAGLLVSDEQRLPAGVPAVLVALESLPLNVNGKVDRQALVVPQTVSRRVGRAAVTPEECAVCQGIADVLGLSDVGADDDFFALGGDSISAMALGNVLRRAGFLLRPKEIFAQRSAEKMALALQPLKSVATQQHDAAFTLPELPMTRWFSSHFSTGQHFAHAVIVNVPDSVSVVQLEIGLSALMRAHPVLRSVYENGVLQVPTMADVTRNTLPASWISASEDDYDTSFQRAISRLNPAAGIMGQLVLCHQNSQQLSLMVVLHHLVVDGVSWRILLPELEFAVMSAVQGAASIIPPEEYALADWADRKSVV